MPHKPVITLNFTYFPKKGLTGEYADDVRQFLNSIADAGEAGEENLEADTAASEAAEAEAPAEWTPVERQQGYWSD